MYTGSRMDEVPFRPYWRPDPELKWRNNARPRYVDGADASRDSGVIFSLREPDRTDPMRSTTIRELDTELRRRGFSTSGNKKEKFDRYYC